MNALTGKEIRQLTVVALVIFMMGVIVGMCIKVLGVDAAAVDAHDEVVFVDRSVIEGGGMPCESVENAPVSVPATDVDRLPYKIPHRAVNGQILVQELQEYLYRQLDERHIGWFYDVALCQIYQESRFDCYAQNRNGLDCGLCQFRVTYWNRFAQDSGLYTYDIWNPIDQIYVYSWMMAKYIREEGSVEMALSRYYTGTPGTYCDSYVRDVMQWANKIQEVE